MQSKGRVGQGLKLQSYKLDNQVLVSKINELNDLKSELETTLSKHRHHQNSIYEQSEQLRGQNDKLRAYVSELQFTKKSQTYLIEQLEKRVEAAENKLATHLKRLQKEQRQRQSMKDFYQKQIAFLQAKIDQTKQEYNQKFLEISRVTEYKTPIQPPFRVENLSISSIEGSSKGESNKKIKKLKKTSLQSTAPIRVSLQISDKYKTDNTIFQKQEDSNLYGQDVYLQMIRQLYKQLLKIEIKGRELMKIPQIQAFSQLRNPTKNDLAKLCASYPFHIRDSKKVDQIFEYNSKESERKGRGLTGRFIIQQIINQIEQVEGAQEIRLNDHESSSFFSEYQANNRRFESQKAYENGRCNNASRDQRQSKKMSIDSQIDIDSQSSNNY